MATVVCIIERNDTINGTPDCIVSDDIPPGDEYDAYRLMVEEVRSNRSAFGHPEQSAGITLPIGNQNSSKVKISS